jgi:hypothetical protein
MSRGHTISVYGRTLGRNGEASRFLSFEVGDDTFVNFWYALWCGDLTLKAAYLELFRIARNKDALVADHIQYLIDAVHWFLHFTCPLQDCELESISSFLDLLFSSFVKGHGVDVLCWKGSKQKGCHEILLLCFNTK